MRRSRKYLSLLPRDGRSIGPTYVMVQLVYQCNLKCWFCGQWGSNGLYKLEPTAHLRQRLSLDTLTRLLNQLPPWCDVYLWGGETLLHPDAVTFARMVRETGRQCWLVTNGTLLTKKAREIVESGITSVDLSIDAAGDEHDRLRGVTGTYRAAIEGIRSIRALRTGMRVASPHINVFAILLPGTEQNLKGLAREVGTAGADSFTLAPLSFVSEDQGRAHEQAMKRLFSIAARTWRGYCWPGRVSEPGSAEAIVREVQETEEFAGFITVLNEGFWRPADWSAYYTNRGHVAPPGRRCVFPSNSVNVFPDGSVSRCPEYADYVVGDVHNESFSSIWNGEKLCEFRRALRREGRFPICSTCCHLYQFTSK